MRADLVLDKKMDLAREFMFKYGIPKENIEESLALMIYQIRMGGEFQCWIDNFLEHGLPENNLNEFLGLMVRLFGTNDLITDDMRFEIEAEEAEEEAEEARKEAEYEFYFSGEYLSMEQAEAFLMEHGFCQEKANELVEVIFENMYVEKWRNDEIKNYLLENGMDEKSIDDVVNDFLYSIVVS